MKIQSIFLFFFRGKAFFNKKYMYNEYTALRRRKILAKEFLNEDFMLQNETAGVLYHDYAKDMPIIDYHCHLPLRT